MLSIVLPTHNYAHFLPEVLDSLLAQTYRNWELVIVDDASTDDTEDVCKPYLGKSHNIQYVRREVSSGMGPGGALNAGFALTRGAFETWWAGDNIPYPNAWETLMAYLDRHPDVDYVYGNNEIGIMDETGMLETRRVNLWEEVDQAWAPDRLGKGYFLGCIWIWRRHLREAVGEFQTEPCEDYDFVLRAEEMGFKFAHVDVCLGWFRRHPHNVTATKARPGNYTIFVQDKRRQRQMQRGLV
ncbi:MAG: glycosyltransferase family A protein [Patescibacteria group bacterium]